MPSTNGLNLPTVEELTVPEIKLSMAALYAGAHHLGKACENANNEFVLCKSERYDPRQCIEEGKEVTDCALKFFQQIKSKCHYEFEQFANCLQKNSSDWDYSKCRNTQGVFDKCMLDQLGMERPPWGWNTEIHIHKSKRERPPAQEPYYPDKPVPYVPPESPKGPKHIFRTDF